MGSKAVLDPQLETKVFLAASIEAAKEIGPADIFRQPSFLVIDNIDWPVDIGLIQEGLISHRRKFKEPFSNGKPIARIWNEVTKLKENINKVFEALYLPDLVPSDISYSYRPLVTGPEPLDFDTFDGDPPRILCFVNISAKDRIYGIGPSFPLLLKRDRALMKRIIGESFLKYDLSYAIRERTLKNEPPLGYSVDKHIVLLAPRSIWFFDPKTVSHEVIYGEGVVSVSWSVPGQTKTQKDYLTECGLYV